MRVDDIGAAEDQTELTLPFQHATAVGADMARPVAVIDFPQGGEQLRLLLLPHGQYRGEVLETEHAWIGHLSQQPALGPRCLLPSRRARQ